MISAFSTYRHKTILWYASLLLITAVIAACGGKDITGGDKEVTYSEPAPEWISRRPINSAYYIGIGSSSKAAQPLDYATVAKKNALNDLATEIRVRVQGNTFMNTLEVNRNFSEEFMSTISTTTNEEIEDFEIAGLWENEKEYWIYYRLDKAGYQMQKREKKNRALNASYDYYSKGLAAESEGNIPSSIDLFMRGLFELKEYWNEVNNYMTPEGKEVFLDNEIYSSIQRVCNGMVILSQVDKIQLHRENSYTQQVPFTVSYQGKPVRGITLQYSFDKGKYARPKDVVTDEKGSAVINVSDINPSVKVSQLEVKINCENLAGADLDKGITGPLLKNTRPDRKTFPIEILLPTFQVSSTENQFGQPSGQTTLAHALKKNMTTQGLRFVDDPGAADYTISINSNTTQGGMAQGFHVAFLEMSVQVKDVRTGQTVYSESLNNIKGLQLNTEAAGIDAYKKGAEKIDETIAKALIDVIL
ncbi:MAG: hypothetical protein RL220_673 [Bacteroidota bacterium]